MQALVIVVVCALTALSLKSALVLGKNEAWTAAGWWLTVLYLVAVLAKTLFGAALPLHGEYAILVLLVIAFTIAGIRDERQAEPWWWPVRRGRTRREGRRA